MFKCKKIKKCLSVLISILTLCLFSSKVAFSHEMYYYKNSQNETIPISLYWTFTSGSKRDVKCNGDNLSNPYKKYYNTAVSVWNLPQINIYNHSFNGSKVDLSDASTSWWDNNVGSKQTLAITTLTDTAGRTVNSTSAALASTKQIRYAAIHFSPYTFNYGTLSTNQQACVLVHEIGHALCLGHSNAQWFPTSVSSVMRTPIDDVSYYQPQYHDKNDIAGKY